MLKKELTKSSDYRPYLKGLFYIPHFSIPHIPVLPGFYGVDNKQIIWGGNIMKGEIYL